METFVFGDSHCGLLTKAKIEAQAQKPGHLATVRPVRVDNGLIVNDFVQKLGNGREAINPIVAKAFSDFGLFDRYTLRFTLGERNVVMLFAFGDVHAISHQAAAWGNFTFDVADGSAYFLQPDFTVELLKVRYKSYLQGLKILDAQKGKSRLFLLAGPQPHRSNETILKLMTGTKALPIPAIRLAVFHAMRTVAADWTRELGMGFLDYSSESVGPDGFLRQEYEGDGIHGNLAYGKMILERLKNEPLLNPSANPPQK
jgi:hypothetical protein